MTSSYDVRTFVFHTPLNDMQTLFKGKLITSIGWRDRGYLKHDPRLQQPSTSISSISKVEHWRWILNLLVMWFMIMGLERNMWSWGLWSICSAKMLHCINEWVNGHLYVVSYYVCTITIYSNTCGRCESSIVDIEWSIWVVYCWEIWYKNMDLEDNLLWSSLVSHPLLHN